MRSLLLLSEGDSGLLGTSKLGFLSSDILLLLTVSSRLSEDESFLINRTKSYNKFVAGKLRT